MDASAIVGVLLDPGAHEAILDLLADDASDLVVPHVCDVEVLSVLRRVALGDEATPSRTRAALELLPELPLRRFDHLPLLERAFALRENFSAYDAVYVALAEGLGATLVTGDARLARAVQRWTNVAVRPA